MSEFAKVLIQFTVERDIRSVTWLAVVLQWIHEQEGDDDI